MERVEDPTVIPDFNKMSAQQQSSLKLSKSKIKRGRETEYKVEEKEVEEEVVSKIEKKRGLFDPVEGKG
jgi:hypothetical protein